MSLIYILESPLGIKYNNNDCGMWGNIYVPHSVYTIAVVGAIFAAIHVLNPNREKRNIFEFLKYISGLNLLFSFMGFIPLSEAINIVVFPIIGILMFKKYRDSFKNLKSFLFTLVFAINFLFNISFLVYRFYTKELIITSLFLSFIYILMGFIASIFVYHEINEYINPIKDFKARISYFTFRILKDSFVFEEAMTKMLTYINNIIYFNIAFIFLEDIESKELSFYFSSNKKYNSLTNSLLNFLNDNKGIACINKKVKSSIYDFAKVFDSISIFPVNYFDLKIGYITFLNFYDFAEESIEIIEEISEKISFIVSHFRQIDKINIYAKHAAFDDTIRLFQRTAAHDIKGPLRGIQSALNLIKEKYYKDDNLMLFVERIGEAAESAMEQSIESISMISEMPEKFEISYLTDELKDLKRLAEMEKIDIVERINISEILYGPKKSIRNMVRSVVKNAIEALEVLDKEGRCVEIDYFRDPKDKKFTMIVRDNGIGIIEEHKSKVFETFSYGKYDGSGYGLTLAKYVADKLNGTLEIDSVPNNYTVVTIKIDV
jgi:signal transduction histidine kinase